MANAALGRPYNAEMLSLKRPKPPAPEADSAQLGTLSPLEPSSGHRSWAMHRWHKEKVQLFPKSFELYEDVPRLFNEWTLPGYFPPRPLLTAHDTVVTLGSCFALELRRALEVAQFASGSVYGAASSATKVRAVATFLGRAPRARPPRTRQAAPPCRTLGDESSL